MIKLTFWVCPKDVPLRMRPLALHTGPYGDVLRTSGRFSGLFLLFFIAFIWFSSWSLIVFICFSNASTRGEYANLPCSIILPWSGGNISSPARYSYFSILPYDKADIFAAAFLISYYSFSSLTILSLLVFILFLKNSSWNVKNYLMQK